ncbi:MAG: hypothetical protein M3011_14245, partial [Actinomycetota bacterium]|nr:hypothetical protein [Actinomycetota bacterium]
SEERRDDDHLLDGESISVDSITEDGGIGQAEVAALVGLNTDLRREYISDCQNGVDRWNRTLEDAGLAQRLRLPHVAFNRQVGVYSGIETTSRGERISAEDWARRQGEWLPTGADREHVQSLMQPVHQQGQIAAWIAPPPRASTASRSTMTTFTLARWDHRPRQLERPSRDHH